MEENKAPITDIAPDAPDSSAGDAVCETKKTKWNMPKWVKAVSQPYDGMRHSGLAFLLPVVIMTLIYIAMEVWPFGEGSVLVLDLNGQYVYYFEAIRDILRGEQGIIYSFERALGGEFLGIVAYYLASPFSIITALFPEGMITESIAVMLLLKCGLSGMNMCIYLHKSHPTKPVNELIFSLMYALCSYAVVMQHNTMWFDCVLFFPLIMLGVESLIKYGKYKLFVLTLAVSVFSNYYIGYMVCIGVAAYFFFYYLKSTPEERNPREEKAHFIKSLGRIALFSAIAVGIAAIIILPAYYSLQFGKSTFSNPKFDFNQKFDFLDLISKMYPASYDTVRPEGWPFVYSGTLTLILLPVFFFIKEITARKKIAYGALMAFFIFSFNSTTIDLIWHGMQKPNWLNYRYSFMFCFVIIVMAYKVFEHIEKIDMRTVLGVGAVLGLLVVILQKLEYENLPDLTSVWFAVASIAAYMILLSGCNKRWLEGGISTVLCVFVLLELFCNGLVEVVSLDDDVIYSTRTSYVSFIDKWSPAADWVNENDTSFYRAEKTKHRKTNDNFTLNLRGLSNSTSTLNSDQIKFLQQMGYSSKSHWSKYLGGTPVSDSLLGVKYLLATDTEEVNTLWGDPVFSDTANQTVVYKNEHALPLGYMVSSDVASFEFAKLETPFARMNSLITAMLGEEETVEVFKPYKNLTPTTDNINTSIVSGHIYYKRINEGYDARVTYTFTPVNDYEIYAYFPSDYPRDTKLKLNGADLSEFYTNETYRVISLGKQTAGEELVLTMELDDDRVYIANDMDYIYYLDEALFAEVMPRLQANGYDIDKFTDSSFSGTVSATEDKSLFFLTIPYDEGWSVYVDGEKADTFEVLNSLTAVEITAGEHKVELKYSTWAIRYGVMISAVSVLVFCAILAGDQFIKRRRATVSHDSIEQ